MTGISLHMQWPLTSQSHGIVSQREQLVFCYGSNSTLVLSQSVYHHCSNDLLFSGQQLPNMQSTVHRLASNQVSSTNDISVTGANPTIFEFTATTPAL
jgi:hypothetical protein